MTDLVAGNVIPKKKTPKPASKKLIKDVAPVPPKCASKPRMDKLNNKNFEMIGVTQLAEAALTLNALDRYIESENRKLTGLSEGTLTVSSRIC